MRNKLELSFIANDSRRKATLKKRKRGLLKKMNELTTLCDITGCVIIYSTSDSQPEVWPSPDRAQQVVSDFRMMPETVQRVTHEGFLEKRIRKASEQLAEQRKVNRDKEITQVIFQGITGQNLIHVNLMDLRDLNSVIDKNMEEVNKKREASVADGTVTVVAEPPETVLQRQFQFGGGAEGTVVVAEAPETEEGFDVNGESVPAFGGGAVSDGGEEMMPAVSDGNNLWSSDLFDYSRFM